MILSFSEHFHSFLKYQKVEEFIKEAALIDFRGKHLVHMTGKVKPVFPDGEFQIDLSKLSNISTARLDLRSIGSSTDFHRHLMMTHLVSWVGELGVCWDKCLDLRNHI